MERAKRVLDFTVTLHLYHLFFTILYSGFPTYWIWWVSMFVSLLTMTLLGEYFCMQRELQEIKRSDISSPILNV